jgi:LuxR family maltose regulon positive regulatory protein
MYRLSVLNELCEGLCDALFQGSAHSAPVIGGQNLLRRLERENLFVSTSGSGPGWYRLHPVFRAVLQAHMEENYTRDEIDRLHITAANWHVHQGRFEDALYHARNMPARDALDIFLRHRLALQQLATWQTMEEWLALFPPDLIESHPDLLLSEAWLMLANLRLPETAKLLDKVEAAFNARNEPDVEKWAELKIIRATYFLRTGDTARVLEYLHAAGKIQPVGYFLKEAAISVRSDAYRLEGDIAAWRELLREHLVFTRSAVDNQISLRLLPSLCTLNMVTARPEDAEKTAYFMLTVARERNNQRYIGIASLYLGAVAYQKNELQRAESYFLDALELAPFMDTDKVITCYLGLAATMRALGHKVKAREALENAKLYLVAIHSLDLLPYIEIFDAEMMLRQGTQIYHKLSLPPEWRLLWTDIIYHPGLTLCRNLLAGNRSENRDKVLSMLEEMDEHAVSTGNEFLRIGVLAQAALTLAASERHGDANEYLVRALDLAEGTGCLRIFIDLGIPMARLLHRSGLPQTGIAAKIRDAFTREPPLETEAARKTMVEHLTDQELRVLDFLRQRFSNKEIADQLSITAATVKSHTIRVYQKLDVHCRREAVEKASRLGIFIA